MIRVWCVMAVEKMGGRSDKYPLWCVESVWDDKTKAEIRRDILGGTSHVTEHILNDVRFDLPDEE